MPAEAPREALERLRAELAAAQRSGDLQRASEIAYGEIPQLEKRLAQVLDSLPGVAVSCQVIATEDEAARSGMHGSPTILIDGIDPFAEPGQPASVSCRWC